MKLIVGLGNPGTKYAKTRHNVGQRLVEQFALNNKLVFHSETKFLGKVAELILDDKKIWLLIPTTYMNLSGEAVRAFSSFYQIKFEEVLIVHDDLDFPPGIIKIKYDGGHGGHNGLRSIIDHLHNTEFYRLRIGIGHPGDKNLVTDYVLQQAKKEEQIKIDDAIIRGLNVLPILIENKIEQAKGMLASSG